jgi:hypothetical protein
LRIEAVSESAIERAFRELAQILHPDHSRTNESRFMRNLVAARETLKVYSQNAQGT